MSETLQSERTPFGKHDSAKSKADPSQDKEGQHAVPPKKEETAAPAADPPKRVSYLQLFKYTTAGEKVILIFAFLLSVAHGVVLPLFCVAFGDITSDLTPNKSVEERSRLAAYSALMMFLCAVGNMLTAGLAAFFWGFVGNRLQVRLRKMYFAALTSQEIEYFDLEKAEVLSTRYLTDLKTFQSGQGRINHTMIYPVSMTISGLVLGFVRGWWYSLIVTLLTPLVIVGMVIFVRSLGKEYAEIQKSYEQAGSASEQALSSIRTVKTLNGEQYELNIFAKAADAARLISTKYSVISGFSFGLFFCIIHVSYSINLWLGAVLIDRQVTNTNMGREYQVSDICWIFFAIINGAFAIGHTSPAAKAIMTGAEAAHRIYEVIERVPKIPINDPSKFKPDSLRGSVEFRDVTFAYRYKNENSSEVGTSSKPALKNIHFKVSPGEKVAFVGESGSGKSTTLQLVQRLYDPTSGTVLIDEKDIKDYNLTALRSHIGFVTQEPVLFGLTVKENLLLARPNATDEEIWSCLKQARADEFVLKLPKKLDTYVGAAGGQLSGGQKQRLCIARSLLAKPTLLLMDEATSALDNKTERDLVQILNETAQTQKLTTITVAHRLTTVVNCDRIYVMENGEIVEVGTHSQLLEKDGYYSKLAKIQLGEGSASPVTDVKEIGLQAAKVESEEQKQPEPSPKTDKLEQAKDLHTESNSNDEEAEKAKKELEDKKFTENKPKLWSYVTGNWNLLISGCICSLCCGSMMPIFAIPLAWMIDILSRYDAVRAFSNSADLEPLRSDTTKVVIFFFVMSVIVLVVNALQVYIFTRLGQTVTSKLRINLYRHLLTREVAFFDKPEHNIGTLTSLLSSDCQSVNTLVSSKYRAYFNGLGAFLSGSIVGLIADWRLGLVCLVFSPFIALTGLIDAQTMSAESEMEAKHASQKKEPKIFQEVSTNMKTVSVINARAGLIPHFNQIIDEDYDNLRWQRLAYVSFIFGLGQFSMLATYAFSFWIGTLLMLSGNGLTFRNLFQALFGTIFGALNLGQAQQFAGNLGEAQKSANRVFEIMDVKNSPLCADDTCALEDWTVSVLPKTMTQSAKSPAITFENVSFTYPGRETKAIDNLSFSVAAGEKVGIAGQSGSGKTTLFGLLFRFYEIQSGKILVDGQDIRSIPLSYLRGTLFGMVQQEAALFSRTILENIKYNMLDASEEQVINAATISEADAFIRKSEFEDQTGDSKKPEIAKPAPDRSSILPDGYYRQLGLKGSGISGGQKQRVAIARTVMRNPQVYLFDESTSALDSATENLVQNALNKVTTTKTSLTIAHRLSTIQNSDKIIVIENGRLVEEGSYDTLVQKKGVFHSMLAHYQS